MFHHLCGHPEIGTHRGAVELLPPPRMVRPDGRGICVDVCLALEISLLWQLGLTTTGCCCGHGVEDARAYIGVVPEDIAEMKRLGYAVQPNPRHPGAEDSFVPMALRGRLPGHVIWITTPDGSTPPDSYRLATRQPPGCVLLPIDFLLPDELADQNHADSAHAAEFPEPPGAWDTQP